MLSSRSVSSPVEFCASALQPKFTHRDAGVQSGLKMALVRIYSFFIPFHLLVLGQALRNYPDNEGKLYDFRCHSCALDARFYETRAVGLRLCILEELSNVRQYVYLFIS